MENIIENLSVAEKDEYFSTLAPANLAQFEGQTFGQLQYAKISELADKLHIPSKNEDLQTFMLEHETYKKELLKEIVGEDYFPKYMADLETLRKQRQDYIMQQTEHLYHFSQIPPEKMQQVSTYPQETGNTLHENIGASLCYADARAQTSYPLKPPSNKAQDYQGLSFYTDEQCVLVSGKNFQEYVQSLSPSYRYEVNKSSFHPIVDLSGRFYNEYESAQPADIIRFDGPFNIKDVYQNFDIPIFYIPNEKDKKMLHTEYSQLIEKGMPRKKAMTAVYRQHPDKMKLLQEDEHLQQIVRHTLEESQNETQISESPKAPDKLNDEKARSTVLIKRGLQNPKCQKFAEQIADKQIKKTGQGLSEEDMKTIKTKIISKTK